MGISTLNVQCHQQLNSEKWRQQLKRNSTHCFVNQCQMEQISENNYSIDLHLDSAKDRVSFSSRDRLSRDLNRNMKPSAKLSILYYQQDVIMFVNNQNFVAM